MIVFLYSVFRGFICDVNAIIACGMAMALYDRICICQICGSSKLITHSIMHFQELPQPVSCPGVRVYSLKGKPN